MIVESVLRTGRAEGKNPLRAIKEIGKLLRFKDYQMLKTGDELPAVVKNLLGEDKRVSKGGMYRACSRQKEDYDGKNILNCCLHGDRKSVV